MVISILTPSFNSGKFIERAIQSVQNQSYSKWEHIIVDGGSNDETERILKKYPHINWLSEPDQGQSDAMNKAFRISTGDIIVYLNADDEFNPGAFAYVVNYFNNNPACDFLLGNLYLRGGSFDRLQIPSRHLGAILKYENWTFPFNPVAYFYRRKIQESIGNFPVNNHYTMDYWFLLRAYKKFTICKCDFTLGTFHYHDQNKSLEDASKKSKKSLKKVRREFILQNPGWFLIHQAKENYRRINSIFAKQK